MVKLDVESDIGKETLPVFPEPALFIAVDSAVHYMYCILALSINEKHNCLQLVNDNDHLYTQLGLGIQVPNVDM